MTQVRLKYRRIDGSNLDGSLITVGSVTITPLDRRDTSDGQMTTAALTVQLAATPPTKTLAPGGYRFRVQAPGLDNTEVRMVPASGGPYDVDDLDEFTPTGSPVLAPEWKTYIDTRIAEVVAGTVTPAGIAGSTAVGQALIVAADGAAARGVISAAPSSHTHPVGQIAVTGGAPSSTTFLRGDGTWSPTPAAGNPDWDDVNDRPTVFPTEPDLIAGASAVGKAVLTAADVEAVLAALGALSTTDPVTVENAPPGSVVRVSGASTPRPTSRTDITIVWVADSWPTNSLPDDLFLNSATP